MITHLTVTINLNPSRLLSTENNDHRDLPAKN